MKTWFNLQLFRSRLSCNVLLIVTR